MTRIFWLSFILLFGEILALRWLGIEVPVIRTFPNLVIMVCLVAASAGISKASAKSANSKTTFVAVTTACLALLLPLSFAVQIGLPKLSLKFGNGADSQTSILLSVLVLLVVVSSLYVTFHCIGKWLGKEFENAPPLAAYSYNLLGSIAGTVAFALISWLGLPPPVWILVAGMTAFFLYRKPLVPIITIVVAAAAFSTSSQSFWSPYSKLDVKKATNSKGNFLGDNNYVLHSNNGFFHWAIHMVPPDVERKYHDDFPISHDVRTGTQEIYPYSFMRLTMDAVPNHDRMLVLGAGSGNDVSYGLVNGAKHITAVEIDPIIAKLGHERHPDKPYNDPRVDVRNEDARTFLRYSKDKFDLVDFAFLDPGLTINSASFLRVDNYVYTVESIKAALKLCDTNGVVVMTFATGDSNPITARLYQTITEANGGVPPQAFTNKSMDSVFFVFGPGAKPISLASQSLPFEKMDVYKPSGEIRASTDQWPFLYLSYDPNGIWMYVTILVVAVVLPAMLLLRGGGTGISGAEWANMFFLGQAFMLMETKSITHLSLLLGATWIVSSAVILTVLLFAYGANLLVSKKMAPPIHVLYACLALSLMLQLFIQIPESSTLSAPLITAIYCFIDCFPILFGSMIFSTCFGKTKFSTQALSANLLGVSIGGLTENICIFTGTANLTYVAIVLYALSFVAVLRRKSED